ncbi:hypothetical protein BT63DRAFT_123791 [Microthyrium microscopicum]|uniref:Clr5 domain-containing protein n=1 Tax=Microthyrium microscopicum TaxID=703497 RepID=A0A6A6TVW5_9PEZI|nr:hypothetical protein BT63DRAFT_123791 [Microthyrium microscopicum]
MEDSSPRSWAMPSPVLFFSPVNRLVEPQATEAPPNMTAPISAAEYSTGLPSNLLSFNDRIALTASAQARQMRTSQASASAGLRSKYQDLNWSGRKKELKTLWLRQNKRLEDVMQIMSERGFVASRKAYKEQFGAWKWKKNLPARHAEWIVRKADQRKRDDGSETVFLYGGLQYDKQRAANSAKRSKKTSSDVEMLDMETPASISYETPASNAPYSPGTRRKAPSSVDSTASTPEPIAEDSDESGSVSELLALRWEGYSASDLMEMKTTAENFLREGQVSSAEDLLVDVLAGLSYIFGATHEDTILVAWKLATLYVESERDSEADKIIDDILHHHVKSFGLEHKRTRQLVLDVVGLLNGWNRQKEALALLSRAKEIQDSYEATAPMNAGRQASKKRISSRGNHVQQLSQSIRLEGGDSSKIENAIKVAQAHSSTTDSNTNELLKTIIEHCRQRPVEFAMQHLQAHTELLRLFKKQDAVVANVPTFQAAVRAFETATRFCTWDPESMKSLQMLETFMELAAAMLNAGFDSEAGTILRMVSQKAEAMFHEFERTIWVLISIGLIYQRYRTWLMASPWFQHALSLAYLIYDHNDGVIRSLEAAERNKRFSYVSDEGRPFKTIFGVQGLIVRPMRLHLE